MSLANTGSSNHWNLISRVPIKSALFSFLGVTNDGRTFRTIKTGNIIQTDRFVRKNFFKKFRIRDFPIVFKILVIVSCDGIDIIKKGIHIFLK